MDAVTAANRLAQAVIIPRDRLGESFFLSQGFKYSRLAMGFSPAGRAAAKPLAHAGYAGCTQACHQPWLNKE
jgi:hypothetical protein